MGKCIKGWQQEPFLFLSWFRGFTLTISCLIFAILTLPINLYFVIVPGSSTCIWVASCVFSPGIPPFCFHFVCVCRLFHQYSFRCSPYFSGLFSVVFYLFCCLRLLFPFGCLPGFCCPDSALFLKLTFGSFCWILTSWFNGGLELENWTCRHQGSRQDKDILLIW